MSPKLKLAAFILGGNSSNVAINKAALKIYDVFGREVVKFDILVNQTIQTVDLSDFVSGTYFSSLEGDKGVVIGIHKFQKL